MMNKPTGKKIYQITPDDTHEYQKLMQFRHLSYKSLLKYQGMDTSNHFLLPCQYDEYSTIYAYYNKDRSILGTIRLTAKNNATNNQLDLEQASHPYLNNLLEKQQTLAELSRLCISKSARNDKKVLFRILVEIIRKVRELNIDYLVMEFSPIYAKLYKSLGVSVKYTKSYHPILGNQLFGYIKTKGIKWSLIKLFWQICSKFPFFYRKRTKLREGIKISLYTLSGLLVLKVLVIITLLMYFLQS